MEPGTRLSKYSIVEKLASSDVGEVYVAEALDHGHEVVLKVLRPELAEDVRRITKFKIKAAAVSKVDHPNIVPILAMEKADGSQFIATPRIDGRPLDEVTGGTGLLLDRIFKLAAPLADAIAVAHDADVVHGGLKPSNVMMAKDGRPLVIDFAMNVLHADPMQGIATAGDCVDVDGPIDGFDDPVAGRIGDQPTGPIDGPADGQLDGFAGGPNDSRLGPASAPGTWIAEGDLEGTSLGRKNPLEGIDDLPPPKKQRETRGTSWAAWGEETAPDGGATGNGGAGAAAEGALADDAAARAGIAPPSVGPSSSGDRVAVDDPDAGGGARPATPAEAKLLETISYLAPEQIAGEPPDARSDIFSLGVLLYRMATGSPAFPGDTPVAVAKSVLADTPAPISDVNPGLPRHLGRIIGRCLEKDSERRYQSARDLHNELEGLKAEIVTGGLQLMDSAPATNGRADGPPEGRSQAARQARTTANGRASGQPIAGGPDVADESSTNVPGGWEFVGDWRFWSASGAVLVVALLGGYLLGSLGGGPSSRAGEMSLARLTLDAGVKLDPNITPAGDEILYASPRDGDWDLYLQGVGERSVVNLTIDSPDDDSQPALSPDGRRVAFRSERDGGGVFVMDSSGESVRRLAEQGFNPAWSPDGNEIVAATEGVLESPFQRERLSELRVFDVSTGESRLLESGDAVQPAWSPGGNRIAYWGMQPGSAQTDIWTLAVDGGEAVQVTNDAATDWSPAWSPDGQYLYFASDRSGSMNIWRARIDEESGDVRGQAEPVTASGTVWSSHPSFARDVPGRMVYVESRRLIEVRGIPFNSSRGTAGDAVVTVTAGARNAATPDASPDGEWVAFATGSGQQEDIYVVRSDGSELTSLTIDAARDRLPRWSPDGRRLAFVSNRSGSDQIWSIRADGSDLRQVTAAGGRQVELATWSPNGSQMCLNTSGDLVPDLTFLIDPREGPDQQTLGGMPPMLGDATFQAHSWSPDASRLAGTLRTANGSSAGIALYAFGPQEYEQLTEYGAHPAWLSDNRRLLFEVKGKILLVDRRSGDVREVYAAAPDEMAEGFSLSRNNRWIYVTVKSTDSALWLLDSGLD